MATCDTNKQLTVSLCSQVQPLVLKIKRIKHLLLYCKDFIRKIFFHHWKRNFVSPQSHVISSMKWLQIRYGQSQNNGTVYNMVKVTSVAGPFRLTRFEQWPGSNAFSYIIGSTYRPWCDKCGLMSLHSKFVFILFCFFSLFVFFFQVPRFTFDKNHQ